MAFSAYSGHARCGCLPFGDIDPTYTPSSYDISPTLVKRINVNYAFAKCLKTCACGQVTICVGLLLKLIYEYVGMRYALTFSAYSYILYGTYAIVLAACTMLFAGCAIFWLTDAKCAVQLLAVYAVGFALLLAATLIHRQGMADNDRELRLAIAAEERRFDAMIDTYAQRCKQTDGVALDDVQRAYCEQIENGKTIDTDAVRDFFARHEMLPGMETVAARSKTANVEATEDIAATCTDRLQPSCKHLLQRMIGDHIRFVRLIVHMMLPNGIVCVCMLLMCLLSIPPPATETERVVEMTVSPLKTVGVRETFVSETLPPNVRSTQTSFS